MAVTFISNHRVNLRHVRIKQPCELVTGEALERI